MRKTLVSLLGAGMMYLSSCTSVDSMLEPSNKNPDCLEYRILSKDEKLLDAAKELKGDEKFYILSKKGNDYILRAGPRNSLAKAEVIEVNEYLSGGYYVRFKIRDKVYVIEFPSSKNRAPEKLEDGYRKELLTRQFGLSVK